MEKKILILMGALVVVAVLVAGVVLVASGGFARAGGFTKTFDKLTNVQGFTYDQRLSLPDDWRAGDVKKISDTIVDMYYHSESHGYHTSIWFAYEGDKWNDPLHGTHFYVPTTGGSSWLEVEHGLFSIDIWTATNLSAKYNVGDTIVVQTVLVTNDLGKLAFSDEWSLAGIL